MRNMLINMGFLMVLKFNKMSLDELIAQLEELRDYHEGSLDIAVQVPPATKCWENSWTQFSVDSVSTDGGSVYLQCS